MSNTPRTDACLLVPFTDGTMRPPDANVLESDDKYVKAQLSRELECENAALQTSLAAIRTAALRFAVVAVYIVKTKTLLLPEEQVEWERTCGELTAAIDATGKEKP